MSAYEAAYEASVTRQLSEYADKHYDDAKNAYAALITKLSGETYSWYGQTGPFGYHVAWHAEATIAAELTTYIAMSIRESLGREEPYDGTPLYESLQKDLTKAVRSGVSASSSGRFHNPVAQAIASSALDLTDGGSFHDLMYIPYAAKNDAENTVVPAELTETKRRLTAELRELTGKAARAKTVESTTRHEIQIGTVTSALELTNERISVAIADAKK